jgi:glycosyltransferase involved in cell wall biosynthesis
MFIDGLEKTTGKKWHIKSYVSNEDRGRFAGIIRACKYFYFSLLIFLQRKKYKNVVAWQQFYGLLLAFYCRLFCVKKTFSLIVMMFIYKEKPGILGSVYRKFITYIIKSKYIDKIIVFSANEVNYYAGLFSVDPSLFVYIPLGIEPVTDLTEDENLLKQQYILSVGRSNRDYDFLLDALKNTPYKVKILSDTLQQVSLSNIEIHNDVFGKEMFHYMNNCFCVVIPLMNPQISSGQLVLLNAMQLGKPVIVTESEGISDYIVDRYNGLIIKKEKEALLAALQLLYSDTELYRTIAENGKFEYEKKYSIKQLGVNVGEVIYIK